MASNEKLSIPPRAAQGKLDRGQAGQQDIDRRSNQHGVDNRKAEDQQSEKQDQENGGDHVRSPVLCSSSSYQIASSAKMIVIKAPIPKGSRTSMNFEVSGPFGTVPNSSRDISG